MKAGVPGTALLVAALVMTSGTATTQEGDIARLIAQLQDDKLTENARSRLLRIGRPAAVAVMTALQDKAGDADREGAMILLDMLGGFGPDAVDAIPFLLRDLVPVLEEHFALLDGSVAGSPDARQLIPRMTHTLADLVPYLPGGKSERRAVTEAVRALSSRFHLGALKTMRREQSRLDTAAEVMAGGGDPNADLIAALFEEPRHAARVALVAEHLSSRRVANRDVIEFLGMFLAREADTGFAAEIYLGCARAFMTLAPEDPMRIHALKQLVLLEETPSARSRAAAALGWLGPAAFDAIPELEQAAQDPDAAVAGEAITALGMIGPDAERAIPLLEKLAEHDNRQIAERARAALRQIRKRPAEPLSGSAPRCGSAR